MLAISARFAPLPPSRFFISFVPSAFPPPKKNVRFATFPAFLRIAVLALTLTPFLWPFLSATFLGFSDLDFVLARLGMGAYLPCPPVGGKPPFTYRGCFGPRAAFPRPADLAPSLLE